MTGAWIDASSGASGDMLLGALLGAGVPLDVLQRAVDAVTPEPITLATQAVSRNGFAATRCHVEVADSEQHRTWADVRVRLEAADLGQDVRALALRVFTRLAEAEGAVHGHDPEQVAFHEVGALDAIADVVGVCAGFLHLDITELVVSPVAVGSGSVLGAHGTLPVPPPAVVELLRGVPSYAGPPQAPATELCTPTGAALLTTLASTWGPQPPLTVTATGVGAGGRDPEGHANVLRLLIGAPGSHAVEPDDLPDDLLVLEANVDDLDPRVWPQALEAILSAGARDVWLTPILMKKGRPAHTVSALVDPGLAGAVQSAVLRQTSTIGVRRHRVQRHALPRTTTTVDVGGEPISVKLSRLGDNVVTAQPEYDDVVRAAAVLDRPVRAVLAEAAAAARATRPLL